MAQLMPLSLTVSFFSKSQIGFTFLVPAHPGSPGQRVVKRVCVCVLCFVSEIYVLTTCCTNCQDPNDIEQQQNGGMMMRGGPGGPRGGMRGRGGRGMPPRGGPMMGRGGGSQMMGGVGGRPPMR